MTRTTKEEINGSALYFFKKIHVIMMIVGFVVTQIITLSSIYFSMKNDVNANTDHRKDLNVHMPYVKKVEHFVTRKEFEDMKEVLNEIKEDVKYLRRNK